MKLEDQMLWASRFCGMTPHGEPAHRYQLFFVANRYLGSKSHIDDFQKVLETGVDQKGLWDNHSRKRSGEYVITERGNQSTQKLVDFIDPLYSPAKGNQFECRLTGPIDSMDVEIRTTGKRCKIYLDGQHFRYINRACEWFNAFTGTRLLPSSGFKAFYNMATDQNFDMEWWQ